MHNLNKKLVRRGEELLQKAENRHNLMVEIANYAKKIESQRRIENNTKMYEGSEKPLPQTVIHFDGFNLEHEMNLKT
jgi:hypothetical protein|tara:strand:+ start:1533 stop:1763 length:231 start_codon:yes stop_codon:yes gene_type:complete